MNTRLLVAGVLAMAMGASSAQAITFQFDWSAPMDAANTSDVTMSASGTITIDAAAGATFGIGNLVEADIEVSGSSIPSFFISGFETLRVLSGTIAGDGLSATFTDFFFGSSGGLSFGCDFEFCQQGTQSDEDYNIVSGLAFQDVSSYLSPGRALASLTARVFVDPDPIDPDPIDPDPIDDVSPVPLPASAPLLIGALAGLASWRRRRAV